MQKEIEQIKIVINSLWAKSLAVMLAIVLGFIDGTLNSQCLIMDYCK